MDRKYFLKRTFNTALLARLVAKAIDIFIVIILSFFFYPMGIVLSLIYISIADSLQHGQSVGKKFIGFFVISLEDGTPCSLKQSIIRNLPLSIPLFFAIIPIWGWVLCFLTGLPLIGLELYLLFKLDSGHRIGDVMADTTVLANDSHQIAMRNQKEGWFDKNTEPCS